MLPSFIALDRGLSKECTRSGSLTALSSVPLPPHATRKGEKMPETNIRMFFDQNTEISHIGDGSEG